MKLFLYQEFSLPLAQSSFQSGLVIVLWCGRYLNKKMLAFISGIFIVQKLPQS